MTNYIIEFPGLGLTLNPPAGFSIGSFDVRFYGLIIALGLVLAVVYACRRSKEFGITEDDLLAAVGTYFKEADVEYMIEIETDDYDLYNVEDGNYKVIVCSSDKKYGGYTEYEGYVASAKNNSLRLNLPYSSGIILIKERENV